MLVNLHSCIHGKNNVSIKKWIPIVFFFSIVHLNCSKCFTLQVWIRQYSCSGDSDYRCHFGSEDTENNLRLSILLKDIYTSRPHVYGLNHSSYWTASIWATATTEACSYTFLHPGINCLFIYFPGQTSVITSCNVSMMSPLVNLI